jgi:hypothetical protein
MLEKNTDNKNGGGRMEVVLTYRAVRRISEQFWAPDPGRITEALARAVREGQVSVCGRRVLVELGCILMVGELDGSVFRVETVFNLSKGIPERVKEMLDLQRPSPWANCEVVVREGDGGEW